MPSPDLPIDVLDYEIMGEKASALGRAGRRLERALAALAATAEESRAGALAEARDAFWSLIVTRDAIGLRDAAGVIAGYRVPAEVHAGLYVPRPAAWRRRTP
jgi:hypothetical protein